MMNNFEELIKKTRGIRLSDEERTVIKQSIFKFIKEHPVRIPTESRLNFWSYLLNPKLNYVSAMAILLIISVLVGGGMAVGAEKALPGDTLYLIKVGINEEVRHWLSVSEEAKAEWEVKRVERRLLEAEEMAVRGSLDIEVREKIEANFEDHAERVRARIEKFEGKENFKAAVEVSSKFEASLKAHEKILIRLSDEADEEIKKEVKPIEIRVRSRANTLTETRKRVELKADSVNNEDDNEDKEEDDREELNINSETDVNVESGETKAGLRLKAKLGL